ncbi:MAG TPA: hypothetical protein DCZ94_21575 [Lentisphaeria bacterium]|nr:MAG: hypothetical protein A2X48_14505 [Lentisphaerae bacterium GWF2_49_21]HBC89536.1 hypothetical protein [Lentisphaeria bacterium]
MKTKNIILASLFVGLTVALSFAFGENVIRGTFWGDIKGDITRQADVQAMQTAIKNYAIEHAGESLPTQTGNNGKYLTTNGTDASWAAVSGGTTSTTIINQLSQAVLANSFNQNTAANQAYTVTIDPTLWADGSIVEVLNTNVNYGFDWYTVLMLHANGADDGTVFTDSSKYALTVAAGNQTVTKTATKKYGSASAYFDGTADNLVVTHNNVMNPGTGDFSISTWVNFDVQNEYTCIFELGDTYSTGLMFYIHKQNNIQAYIESSSPLLFTDTAAFTPGQWYHLELYRKSGVVYYARDGVITGTPIADTSNISVSTNSSIGYCTDLGAAALQGYIDDFKYNVGTINRTTVNFTPPALELVNSSIVVDPEGSIKIDGQVAGVSQVLNNLGDYKKYRWDGVQLWTVAHEGTPTIGD